MRAAERGIGPVELARLGEKLGRADWPAAARFLGSTSPCSRCAT